MSAAHASEPASAPATERPSAPAEPQRKDSRIERRIPSARDTLATLPDVEEGAFDFEPHDTIPAPPWLGEEPPPPSKPS